jgi:hypothetical protein
MMEAAYSSKTFALVYQTTRYQNPEDYNILNAVSYASVLSFSIHLALCSSVVHLLGRGRVNFATPHPQSPTRHHMLTLNSFVRAKLLPVP